VESVRSQLSEKELQEANLREEQQKLMETLQATKTMLEDLQEELESHDDDLQGKLREAENKLEHEKSANQSLSHQLQSERNKSSLLAKQLQVCDWWKLEGVVLYDVIGNDQKPTRSS